MSSVSETQADTTDHGQVREIGHEEYDPVGTLALIGLYFALLVVLWIFMYFIEFLGNDPTVSGSIASDHLIHFVGMGLYPLTGVWL